MTETRNILIVVAHPEPKSFNHAMADAAATALRGAITRRCSGSP